MHGWFGPFRVERSVGRGGLGMVHRAIDSRTGATVALKLLPRGKDPLALERTRREFTALRAVQHANIVRVLDAGEVDGQVWLAMEFVDGLGIREWLTIASTPQPLEPEPEPGAHGSEGVDLDALYDEPDSDALLKAAKARKLMLVRAPDTEMDRAEQEEHNRPLRLRALCDALAQIADGLQVIHQAGLVHRDVKPSNILVTSQHRAVLVDFGLVKVMKRRPIIPYDVASSLFDAEDEDSTGAGRTVGTMRYMAPEQARAERVDGRADLYSLGATLYELIAGRPAFPQAGAAQLMEAVMGEMPTPIPLINPGAPHTLSALAHRLLAKAPQTRPNDAAEVAAILRSAGQRFAA